MRRDEIIAKWEALTPYDRDTWVAEVVTGLTNAMNPDGTFGYLPLYSTDISAAWAVLISFPLHRIQNECQSYYVLLELTGEGVRERRKYASAYAPTAPEAICLAALIAKLT